MATTASTGAVVVRVAVDAGAAAGWLGTAGSSKEPKPAVAILPN
jgi:hypothetical protein